MYQLRTLPPRWPVAPGRGHTSPRGLSYLFVIESNKDRQLGGSRTGPCHSVEDRIFGVGVELGLRGENINLRSAMRRPVK
jgi:hypothetical protein